MLRLHWDSVSSHSEWHSLREQMTMNVDENVEKVESLYTADGNAN